MIEEKYIIDYEKSFRDYVEKKYFKKIYIIIKTEEFIPKYKKVENDIIRFEKKKSIIFLSNF